ncbi:MAG: ferredoxin [Saprospiraceae bacterium]|jgi:ferredoxin|nr:ferredoxin [Saprospiraceae bacterium]MBK6564761.1 ferredoxin [Saprospiraceae bacterium]MBK7523404.1 ferredoxin [Saprospiraceae bacterium]MBK8371606.1 ferredoxin [Saprospiraceae bacterium]MBK8548869.1 ferredoxin [Saprospiraceae bacterium]
MIQIIQQREKCIGCNACVEVAPYRWRMSKKDGKCTLVGAKDKKGYYVLNTFDEEWKDNVLAANICPVKIIKVMQL